MCPPKFVLGRYCCVVLSVQAKLLTLRIHQANPNVSSLLQQTVARASVQNHQHPFQISRRHSSKEQSTTFSLTSLVPKLGTSPSSNRAIRYRLLKWYLGRLSYALTYV